MIKKIPSGIYMILNLLNGKRYIGSATNLRGRRRTHFRGLRNGRGENPHLQNAYNKYGRDTFGWEVLEYVEDLESLLWWEDLYLKIYWPSGLLYNCCPAAGSTLGCEWTEEQRHNYRKGALKRWSDPEQHQRASDSALKRWEDPEQHQEASKAALERWADPGYRQMMLEANNNIESRRKKSEAALEHWANPKFRQELIRKNNSVETKRKRSRALIGNQRNKGKLHTIETKKKMSEARKRWWAQHKRDQATAQGKP